MFLNKEEWKTTYTYFSLEYEVNIHIKKCINQQQKTQQYECKIAGNKGTAETSSRRQSYSDGAIFPHCLFVDAVDGTQDNLGWADCGNDSVGYAHVTAWTVASYWNHRPEVQASTAIAPSPHSAGSFRWADCGNDSCKTSVGYAHETAWTVACYWNHRPEVEASTADASFQWQSHSDCTFSLLHRQLQMSRLQERQLHDQRRLSSQDGSFLSRATGIIGRKWRHLPRIRLFSGRVSGRARAIAPSPHSASSFRWADCGNDSCKTSVGYAHETAWTVASYWNHRPELEASSADALFHRQSQWQSQSGCAFSSICRQLLMSR